MPHLRARRPLRTRRTLRPPRVARARRGHRIRAGVVGERPARPDAEVVAYTAAIVALMATYFAPLRSAVLRAWPDEEERQDAYSGARARAIREAQRQAQRRHAARMRAREADRLAREATEATEAFSAREQARVVRSLGLTPQQVDTRRQLAEAAERNVAAIQRLSERAQRGIAELLEQGIREERPRDWIAERIEARFGVASSRAALIANIELRRLNGELARIRQQAAGLTRYVWGPTESRQPRELHNGYRNSVFSWDDPPEGGHPGELPQCKCVAIPIS